MRSGAIRPPRTQSSDYAQYKVIEDDLSAKDMSEVFTRKSFATGRKKCFSFKFFRTQIKRIIMTSEMLLSLYSLHYDKKQKREEWLNYYFLSPDLNNTIIDWSSQCTAKTTRLAPYSEFMTQHPYFTHQRRETHLLPAPHDTRCMDYQRTGMESQLHCLHDCIKHESIRTLRLLPTDVSIFHLNETTVPLISDDEMHNVRIRETLSKIRNSCRQLCKKPNCKDEHFKPFNPTHAYWPRNLNTSIASFHVFVPVWPDILIETGAAFSFIDCLMKILNAVSLWTALCPMNLKDLRLEKILLMCGSFASVRRKTLSRSRRTCKWLLPLLCVTACFYQLQKSAVQYFAYKTVSRLSIRMAAKPQPPAITLCHTLLYGKVRRNMTLAESFSWIDPYLLDIKAESDDSYGITEYFLKSRDACNTFHPTSKYVATSDPQNKMYTIRLKKLKYIYFDYLVSLHEISHGIHGKYDSFTHLSFGRAYSKASIIFKTFQSQLLTPPYETQCRDYTATQFQSQEHCIESCAIQQSLDQRGVFPLFVSAAYDPLPVPFDHRSNISILLTLRRSCRSVCPHPDCHTITFTSRTTSAYTTGHDAHIHLSVSGSTDLSFSTESVAATDSVTFATNFLGCIAFWTGVCPFGVLLSKNIRSFLKRPALPKMSHRCYVIIIVLLSAAAYAYQVLTMTEQYFKYATTNTIKITSEVRQQNVEQDNFSLTLCYEFPSNRIK